MKYIITLLTLIAMGPKTLASDSTIVFRQINYAEIFEVAKEENKGIMLYFHFDGCGACIIMERTAFKDKGVIDYYNKNFINFEINTLKGDGIEINKIYNIKMHPTFIFFDNAGNELHRIVGVFSPEEFYTQANNAMLSSRTLTNYKNQYNIGNRNPDFLLDYAYMLRDANELDSILINEYLMTRNDKELFEEINIKFIYEYMIHRGEICIPYNSPAYLFMANNKNLFAGLFEVEQVNTRLMFVIQSATYDAIKRKDTITFFSTIEALREYDLGNEYYFKEMDAELPSGPQEKLLFYQQKCHFTKKLVIQTNTMSA